MSHSLNDVKFNSENGQSNSQIYFVEPMHIQMSTKVISRSMTTYSGRVTIFFFIPNVCVNLMNELHLYSVMNVYHEISML